MLVKKIHKRKDYVDIARRGKKLNTKNFIIQYKKYRVGGSESLLDKEISVGIVASRKIGNAVKRNFVKRRVRVIVGQIAENIRSHYKIVLVGKKSILIENFQILTKEIKESLKLISIVKR